MVDSSSNTTSGALALEMPALATGATCIGCGKHDLMAKFTTHLVVRPGSKNRYVYNMFYCRKSFKKNNDIANISTVEHSLSIDAHIHKTTENTTRLTYDYTMHLRGRIFQLDLLGVRALNRGERQLLRNRTCWDRAWVLLTSSHRCSNRSRSRSRTFCFLTLAVPH